MSRALAAAFLVALALAGCGGGSDDSSTAGSAAPQGGGEPGGRAYVAAADRICAEMIVESQQMGARFRATPKVQVNALALTTRELVKPAAPILERNARRLRALQGEADLAFDSYVALFDPILSVVRERVRAGEAGDSTRAHELELVLLDLGELQRRLAREAGLKTCDVDFIATFSSVGGSP